ncbi:MAG: hypothetical protein AAFX46_05325, partial [Cyanobacteria bacterium J06636_27]
GPYLGVTMKLNQLFSGFGLQKRVPREKIEQRQTLLNKLKKGTENSERKTRELDVSDIKKNPLGTLAERIKKANKAKKVEKSLLQRLTTVKGR